MGVSGAPHSLSTPKLDAHSERCTQELCAILSDNDAFSPDFSALQDNLLHTDIDSLSLDEIKSSILTSLNAIRVKRGLKKVTLYNSEVAQLHSTYLFESHNDSEITWDDHFGSMGESVLERTRAERIPIDEECWGDCQKVGEIIGPAGMTVEELCKAWEESPDHLAEIVGKSFDAISIGHHPGSNNVVVVFLNLK